MKKTKIIYLVATFLFAAFMLFTAIPDIIVTQEAATFMKHLGYPPYFTPFIGIAKVLGVIAILVPGFPRIREWAYAGLFFDLIGATYSIISTDGLQLPMLFMLVPFVLGTVSYVYYHKLNAGWRSTGTLVAGT
ncbi:MAG: DoxX family protein [Sphingobacteriales bacterium]|nr:MAG: DoxX family protein [Sphingobacteriales bacterium]